MLSFVLSAFSIIFALFFVIITHEFAHYFVARCFKVTVLKFSIGFGKTLFSRTHRSGTEFIIAMIPLGGYVGMLDEREKPVAPEQLRFSFNRQAFYKKALITLAGPAMNLACACLLYWIIFIIGFSAIKPVIGAVHAHSIAAQAGLKEQQEIISINHERTLLWPSVIYRLLAHAGEKQSLTVEVKSIHSSTIQQVELDLSHWELNGLDPDLLTSIGITAYQPSLDQHAKQKMSIYFNHIRYNALNAIPQAIQELKNLIYFNLILIGKLINGTLSLQSLGGPITIFASARHAFDYGFIPYMSFLAFLSISIGLINLLPIPGLDGGHFLIQVIERIIQRPIPLSLLFFLYRLGFIFLFLIFAQAFVNDLMRL